MEFIRGQKLTSLPKHEIRELVEVGANAFLVQLLDVGYLHAGQHLLLRVLHKSSCQMLEVPCSVGRLLHPTLCLSLKCCFNCDVIS